MVKRLKVGVDIDDVLVDFVGAFRIEAERILGRDFSSPPGDWHFKNWNVSKKEIHRVWDEIKDTTNWFFLNTWSYPDVPKNLPWLTENHEVYFITSRIETAGSTIKRQSEMQLDEIGVNYPTVIVTTKKGAISSVLDLQVFIDDKIDNLLQVQESMPNCKIFMRNQSHNEDFDISNYPNWTRVNSFEEFTNAVKELSNAN